MRNFYTSLDKIGTTIFHQRFLFLFLFCAENHINLCRPSNKQNRTQLCLTLEFEKNNRFIEKCVDFKEFRGFINYERKYDLGVNSDKRCLGTHVSQIYPAGLIIMAHFLQAIFILGESHSYDFIFSVFEYFQNVLL